jgi:hypothetical protein
MVDKLKNQIIVSLKNILNNGELKNYVNNFDTNGDYIDIDINIDGIRFEIEHLVEYVLINGGIKRNQSLDKSLSKEISICFLDNLSDDEEILQSIYEFGSEENLPKIEKLLKTLEDM